MGNMSYCRFQNTRSDLEDCRDALDEMGQDIESLSDEEREAAADLIDICRHITDNFDRAHGRAR